MFGYFVALIAASTLTAAPVQADATAGVASVSGTTVQYKAAAGKANDVVVTRSGRTVTIDDVVAVKAGAGCKKVDTTKVRCTTKKTPTRVRVYTFDRRDLVDNETSLPSTIDGGTGNDRLVGGSGNDLLLGGPDHDQLLDSRGNNVLKGGTGHDFLQAGPGADVLLGGAGRDTVDYGDRDKPLVVDLDGASRDDGQAGEHDTVGWDVEDLEGGAGNDRLTGNRADNDIYGWGGSDIIRGGAGDDMLFGMSRSETEIPGTLDGRDYLYGEAGDDWLYGHDDGHPRTDRLDGGTNSPEGDLCKAQRGDIEVNCEY